MDQHDSFFTPERVDEQIDQALDTKRAMSDDQFLAEMQQVARQMHTEREHSLRRVEDRLIQHALARPEKRALAPREESRRRSSRRIVQQGSIHSMEKQKEQKKSRMSAIGRRISLLVAVLVVAVLVGSLVLVMSAARQKTVQRTNNNTKTGAAHTPTATPTPTSTSDKTVYTTPSNMSGFSALAWSPDSTRVASLTNAQNNPVTIWDATTGKNSVTVPLPNEYPLLLAWSPNSQLIAIGTTTGVVIANGQTGAIVKNYPLSMGTADAFPATGSGAYLSARMPAGSGAGVHGLAWSHDGNFLAIATSDGLAGRILVVNPQTFVEDYALPLTPGYVPHTLAWSADGKYVAASVFNPNLGNVTTSGNPLITLSGGPAMKVWVWDTATKQVVFQHSGSDTIDSMAWSPTSDVLAFNSQDNPIALTLWNASTNQLTSFQTNVDGPLAWSPDGKYIAFAGTTANQPADPAVSPISIIDATSGTLVYEYKQMDQQVSTLAWSPDGHYIASGASDFAKIWSAE